MASPADAARWQAVSRLLDAVLDLAPADRATYLDQACAHDPSLRAEIEALLHLEDDDRLEDNAAVFAAPLLSGLAATDSLGAPRSEADPGSAPRMVSQIGPYRLVRKLGRGGMGAVYLAERADGIFEKQVALKVIRQGLDTQDVLNRFAYERQILATLDHPHIARLYDGGLTPDGRPYFVMEYVDGLPLLTYCDQHRLRTEQRLALFRTVCRAVQYAHQNLVVHRDLKPSNILVTTDGQVKLLDFGIAKLLAEEAEEMEPLTMTGQRLMTPAYAAPEQVQGGPITTATDVYQLGVLLYELLTGQRPYEIKKRVRQEIERAVLHATPERPSTLVRKLGTDSTETASTITTARATSIDGLERKLRGDLDTIVLMALKKDPGRRYASAEQLAEDLRRHGQGLPVVAHRDSAGYRVRKWVQRNRAAAAVAVVIGLLLLSTATLGTVFAVTTARQASAIEREATRAEQAAAQAEGVNTFLQDILGSANPAEAGYDVTVLQALRRAVVSADSMATADPNVGIALYTTLGSTYSSLAQYDTATTLLEQGLRLAVAHHGDSVHQDVSRLLSGLATVYAERGILDTAIVLERQNVTIARAAFGPEHPETATSLTDLGTMLLRQGTYEEAETHLLQAASILEASVGPAGLELLTAYGSLGALYEATGDLDRAESYIRQQLSTLRTHHPERKEALGSALGNLGVLLSYREQYAEAEAAHRESLALFEAVSGPSHRSVGQALSNLATARSRQGHPAEALALLERALAIDRAVLGNIHPDIGIRLNNMAFQTRLLGDEARTETLLQETVAVLEAAVGRTHPYTIQGLHNLGTTQLRRGRLPEAQATLEEALDLRRVALGDDHFNVAATRSALGAVLTQRTLYAQAETQLLAGHATLSDALGADHSYTAQAAAWLVELYEAWDKPEQATAYRASSS